MKFLLTISIVILSFQLTIAQTEKTILTNHNDSIKPITNSINDTLSANVPTKKRYKEGTDQFSIFVGGGLSTFKFNPQIGDLENRLGVTIGADYTHYWSANWGISVGLTFDRFNSSLAYHQDSTYYQTIDVDNEDFTLITNFNELLEKQKTWLIGVPIELKYRLPLNEKAGVMIGVGPKLSTSIKSSSQVTSGSYSTKGYYPQYGSNTIIYPGDAPGFDTYEPREKVSSSIGFGISAISDIDLYYRLSPIFLIYGGPYFEYQLNKSKHDQTTPIVEYHVVSPTEAYTTYDTGITENAPSGAKKLAVGAKIGLILDLGGAKNVRAMNADRKAAEQLRLAELKRAATEDSLANAYLLALRQKAQADSIAEVERKVEEARRVAALALLAEQQRINDSITNAKAKNVTVVMDVRTNKLSQDELDVLKLPIVYNFGSADLNNQSKINAQRIGEVLARHPDLQLVITGHTCDIGNENYNYQLGLRRAKSLNTEFTKAGVNATQITSLSKGETEPLLPNTDEMNRQKNRRVVCIIKDEK